ncbi:hypothetical protein GNF10_19555 [Nostoc sp. UCD121]|uniref:hypothetical protein n=1 Tax=unclassified Nostoc TaxID=2593658 RepID=UPI001624D648|nr:MULTISPECIES: hypothetical protein [unclassified Nostoc]MBC1223170.1 hypothetical protein [Nostoc sp. UCD120]MBC1278097.1 hypothetical protein [Nostoc sp. UCD121]MBC1294461.1 hypothetical protein [Nostoc sp. UCD122]
MNWKNIRIAEIQGIEKVVAEFYVRCVKYIPNCQFRVKITQDIDGKYSGHVNLAVRNSRNVSPKWVGGSGDSIDEALENSIKELVKSIKSSGKNVNLLQEEDFEWSAPEDF